MTNDNFEPAPPPARNDPRYAPPSSRSPSNERQFSNPMRPAPVQRQPLEPSYGGRNAGAPMPIVPQVGYQQQRISPNNDPFAINAPSRAGVQSDTMRAAPPAGRKPSVYDTPPPIDDDDEDAPALNGRGAPPPPQRRRVQDEPPPVRSMPSRAPVSVPLGRPVWYRHRRTGRDQTGRDTPPVRSFRRSIAGSGRCSPRRALVRPPVTEIKQIRLIPAAA